LIQKAKVASRYLQTEHERRVAAREHFEGFDSCAFRNKRLTGRKVQDIL
jgi:hypothetical protein